MTTSQTTTCGRMIDRPVEQWNALLHHTVDRLPVVVVRRTVMRQHERNAFKLGVDAGAFGMVAPSQAPNARHLSDLPGGVTGVEIPPS